MKKKGVIICGYSGIGKSHFCKVHPNSIDLDSRWFEKKEGWEQVYIKCALALANDYDYVLLTAHTSSVLALDKMKDISWWLVFPCLKMKAEIEARLRNRSEQPKEWIDSLINFYDTQITKYKTLVKNAHKIELEPGQYLSDVIDSTKIHQ